MKKSTAKSRKLKQSKKLTAVKPLTQTSSMSPGAKFKLG
jgi:hypothetical protein